MEPNLTEQAWDDFYDKLTIDVENGTLDIQTDNSGQLVVYTNQWVWSDGSIHAEPDPEYNDDPTDA